MLMVGAPHSPHQSPLFDAIEIPAVPGHQPEWSGSALAVPCDQAGQRDALYSGRLHRGIRRPRALGDRVETWVPWPVRSRRMGQCHRFGLLGFQVEPDAALVPVRQLPSVIDVADPVRWFAHHLCARASRPGQQHRHCCGQLLFAVVRRTPLVRKPPGRLRG